MKRDIPDQKTVYRKIKIKRPSKTNKSFVLLCRIKTKFNTSNISILMFFFF